MLATEPGVPFGYLMTIEDRSNIDGALLRWLRWRADEVP